MQEPELIESKGPPTEMEKRLIDQLRGSKCSSIEVAKSGEHKGCYYTSIPHFVRNKQVSGDELTALNIDKVIVTVIRHN
jgi:A1 cistron-splicing factor AAR2